MTNLRLAKIGAVIASILLLAGCATSGGNNPQPAPIDRLAKSVTEAGTRVWSGTRYLFKLKERNGEYNGQDEYADEVDLALMDIEDFGDTDAEGAETAAVEGKAPIEGEILELERLEPEIADVADAGETAAEPSAPSLSPSDEDLYHQIGENESLWVLAKMLTGDANNWRELARINDLDEDGSVKVGQTIRVPAALKRVPVEPTAPAEETQLAAAKEEILPAKEPAQAVKSSMVTVQAGESMWSLSGRVTGNPANWMKIAQFNGMDEVAANLIRFGQKLEIPQDLMIEGAEVTQAAADDPAMPVKGEAKAEAAKAVAVAINPKKSKAVEGVAAGTTDGKREIVVAEADQLAQDQSKTVTVPANFKGEPPADLPKEAAAKNATPQIASNALPELGEDEIMVSGTYYPKAIYNEANFSSSLLMRVSPGTKLKVSKAMGPWYEVVTDKGVGFVHSRDTK